MNYGYEYRATLADGTPGGADVNMSMLVADVRAFAKLAPDFKYTHNTDTDDDGTFSSVCSYPPDEYNPLGCIVGAALREQGVVPSEEGRFAENLYFVGSSGRMRERARRGEPGDAASEEEGP